MKTLRGKCPRCCPDGGACFKVEYDYDTGKDVKKCTNCYLMLPLRRVKASGKPTTKQQEVIDRVRATGWTVDEVKMIGRKVWITFSHPTRSWLLGNTGFGTIGVCGAFELKLQTIGKDAVITDDIGIKVYLR